MWPDNINDTLRRLFQRMANLRPGEIDLFVGWLATSYPDEFWLWKRKMEKQGEKSEN